MDVTNFCNAKKKRLYAATKFQSGFKIQGFINSNINSSFESITNFLIEMINFDPNLNYTRPIYRFHFEQNTVNL